MTTPQKPIGAAALVADPCPRAHSSVTADRPHDAVVFERLAAARYSCRAFTPDPVTPEIIRAILASARHAASWCNVQPWKLHLVSGSAVDDLRHRMMSSAPQDTDIAAPPAYQGLYRARRQAAGWQLYDALGITRSDHDGRAAQAARNFCLFDAPHLAVLSTPASMGPYALLDCGGFLAHFQLAARAHGVDTIAQAAIAYHAKLLHEILAIPGEDHVICGISFGYAQPDHPVNHYRTSRAEVDDFTTWMGTA